MDFWTAIVIIVVVASLTETIRQYLKKREKGAVVSEKRLEELQEQIHRQNQRIENLETVILDLEHEKKYREL